MLAAVLALLTGCGGSPRDVRKVAEPAPIFPDYAGVTVPAEIAPLNFSVKAADGVAERVDVTVKGADGSELHCNGRYARFDIDDWHSLLEANKGKPLSVTVRAKAGGEWLQYDDFNIYVSDVPLDEWGLTYRRIAPGYEVYSKMGIYQRDLSGFDEYPLIENTMTGGQCYNCHTPNRTNPDEFLLHVRGEHGATMISKRGECTWLQATNDTLGGAMVYPYWHPSGRYCAFSTNKTRQGFHTGGEKLLEVFDHESDVIIFDTQTNVIMRDSLLCSSTWAENTPVFSPDGKWLYFTTCRQKEYPMEMKDVRYNLCRVAFDEKTGKTGTQVDTIFDAAAMGKSLTWPRPSYDGKYMLFTLSDYGYFSIWHKEADQWLLDLRSGEARPLGEINSDDADSYHNWSGNSRWVVFTSRRGDGRYSRLYIAGIDPEGRFSKPFLLPQENPEEYYSETLYSFNTPDFTEKKVEFDAGSAVRAIMSDERVNTTVR
ncbi:MAG: hypothetical protein K2K93_02940 [Muribaculaceae bacterium]|nr:hypothetical protein [Muribaculaceae bacterium]